MAVANSKRAGLERFTAAALASGVAELLTLPIDCSKVRLQTQKVIPGQPLHYKGMLSGIGVIAREEGAFALWKGVTPALMRQMSYTGLSFVLYEPVRNLIAGEGVETKDIPFWKRVLAGGVAGGSSILCVNPTDVVKTQLQSSQSKQTISKLAQNIFAKDGVKGFWWGVQPNVARCFIGNACEIGVYDGAKTKLVSMGVPNGPLGHLSASACAGIVSAVFSTPVDVVKTRLMNQAGGGATSGVQSYKGVVDAFINMPRQEGISSLYKGFVPLASRKILWTVAYFMCYEQILGLVRGSYMD
mmetsp:Transcript_16330/g.18133  ORF Transcript_16330/g.18133 Transcript_16330/m.18133 type:complete len:300 (+) Transcript_16330:30-929(+)|eukprot:CAMPEP_0205818474 /NCGR_PEP_ID=MMETSP0206-20130828/388_1 /ASSEMBLY_ACC=CAM_ASM_000279 /TAXON_ID=36767 /ORGANISM="Euplotes focardii, Strain TN1" /LENGTH=299 /DNA_ID=CAMNT_0053110857 /DNA_START=30 /DNA_END=929 /DNA_ORIENTATION=+